MMNENRLRNWMIRGLIAVAITVLAPTAVLLAADNDGSTAAAASTVPKLDTGDNGWMLVSSALVLLMTAPGLAMFYSGLVRKKNVLGVMMQCIFLMCLMTVIWALWGYTLSFGGDAGSQPPKWLGDDSHLFMKGVQATWENGKSVIPVHPMLTINRLTHMLFQGMFFIITPALICGAFAERMKFSTMVVFSVLWGTLVYCPLCHAVWGGGVLQYGSENAKDVCLGGALDFAGGTVVHISSGVSALVCALVLGKRLGYGSQPMPPHNLTYTALGAAMLWVGWFGFNAGSALNASGLAASAFCATHFAAAAGGLTWAAMEWITRGKPSILGTCSGVVAGLVCITPAAGYVTPMPALLMGVAVGIVCFLACTSLKAKFRYDDSLDAFGVHGVGGTLGAILTGVFATRATGAFSDGKLLGLLEGGKVLTAQIIAVAITWVLAIAATYVILKALDATMGLRVSQAAEIEGLDLSQHGEEGYIFI
jgi:ammonium transporter, Amt family